MDDIEFEEFQRAFAAGGVFGAELHTIVEMEADFGSWAHGAFPLRNRLTEALLGFCVSTFHLAVGEASERAKSNQQDLSRGVLAWYVGNFKRFRAAETAFYSGYGMSAASLLRDVRDWCYLVTAMQHGIVTWHDVHGGPMGIYAARDPELEAARRKTRMQAEGAAKRWAIGRGSGLQDIQRIRVWNGSLNHETHGALYTTMIEGRHWLEGNGDLQLGPVPDPHNQRLYVSRSLEIGHLFLRLLPVLQCGASFGEKWAERWHCLDDVYKKNWTSDERIARYMPAFADLVAVKFPFCPEQTRQDIQLDSDGPSPVLDY